MPKSISAALLAHKSGSSATLALCLHVGPLSDGSYIGLTSLDANITYNPHDTDADAPDVAQVFYASTGAEVSAFASANDLSVNNGEARTLLQQFPGQGVSVAQVDNGDLDGVEYTLYQVNYRDLTMGHEILANGPTGEWRVTPGGLVTFELRAWSDLLRQNSVCELDSLTCRVKQFGSQPGDERFPCGYDLVGNAEWITGVAITSLGTETVREFTASSLLQAADYFAPGVIYVQTGANAGRTLEIESFASGGGIVLQFAARHPFAPGDLFDIRRDCSREWTGHNSCNTFWGTAKGAHFRGEPFIPVSSQIALTVPGAAAGGFQ